jgi:hypothetical protein
VNAATLAVRKGPISSRLRYYYYYAFTALWLVTSLSASRSGGHWDLADIGFGLSIVPFLAVILWIPRLKFGREFQRSANLHGIQQLDASESGIRLVTSESETRSTWKTYSKFAESSRVFILFHLGSKTFIPIPKSALNSEQVTELRSLFKTSLAR